MASQGDKLSGKASQGDEVSGKIMNVSNKDRLEEIQFIQRPGLG